MASSSNINIMGEVSALTEFPEARFSFVGGVLQVVTCSGDAETRPIMVHYCPAV